MGIILHIKSSLSLIFFSSLSRLRLPHGDFQNSLFPFIFFLVSTDLDPHLLLPRVLALFTHKESCNSSLKIMINHKYVVILQDLGLRYDSFFFSLRFVPRFPLFLLGKLLISAVDVVLCFSVRKQSTTWTRKEQKVQPMLELYLGVFGFIILYST